MIRGIWRQSHGLLLAVACCALAVWLSWTPLVKPFTGPWEAVGSQWQVIQCLSPLCVAHAAVTGMRYRRSRLWSRPLRRSQALVVLSHLWPSLAVMTAVVLLGVAVVTTRSHLDLSMLALVVPTQLLTSWAWVLLGYAVGTRSATPLVVPVLIIASFYGQTYTVAMQPMWLRLMTRIATDCCAPSARPEIGGVVALVATSTALGCLAWALFRRGALLPRLVWALAGVLLVSAGAAAAATTTETSYALTARHGRVECRAVAGLQVCTWPGSQAFAADLERVVPQVYAVAAEHRIDLPRRLSEGAPDGGLDEVRLLRDRWRQSPDSVGRLVVSDIVGFNDSAQCLDRNNAAEGQQQQAEEVLRWAVTAWWERRLGQTPDDDDEDMEAKTRAAARAATRALETMPRERRADLIERTRRALITCDYGAYPGLAAEMAR